MQKPPVAITALMMAALVLACDPRQTETDPHPQCPEDLDGDGSISMPCGGDDCDDEDGDRFPTNAEICDAENKDEDCNPTTLGNRDTDGDGHYDALCCNLSAYGDRLNCGDDCVDLDATIHPRAPEVCDGIDNDCNGAVDDGVMATLYLDADGDGHGAGPAVMVCAGSSGYSTLANDCDDTAVGIYPGMIRCTEKFAEYELCQGDGTFAVGYCDQQRECAVQPGGWGICR